ncbi:MAG: ABC transporter substrate-binding protein, partial [Candidatus Omnitrophica bacterium]|nr:ABC transporter substrate-binding protein [Candidatus Omnitrophota bacterium]
GAMAEQMPFDRHGGQIVFTTTSDPKSFNPITAQETSSTAIIGYLFEGLTRTNGVTLAIEPNLAQNWTISPDGLIWTFYLRKDVLWSDGKPFTADDVIFTFNDLIYNEKIPSSERDIFTVDGKIFEVKKIDDYTIQFKLPMKFAPFLRALSTSILPRHKLETAVNQGRFSFIWGIDTLPKEIVGTGPYTLETYEPGKRVVLKANPLYWRTSEDGQRLPYVGKIIYVIVQNQDIALLKFLEGEIDSISCRGMDFPLLKPMEKVKNFTLYDLGSADGSNFIVFNQNTRRNPKTNEPFVDPIKFSWFSNVNFRKAVAHAIDKKKIIEIVMNGLGYPQNSSLNPTNKIFYNPSVDVYDYNLDQARQILANEGFLDRNGDGIIEDKKGNKVEFNLCTNSNSVERLQIAAIIRHDLGQLGMKVNFVALEFNNLVSKLMANYDWDAVILGLTGGLEPHFGKNVWVSSGQLHFWNPGQKEPQTTWEKRIDDIFTQGVQILDDQKRKPFYDEWQMIVSQELPLIYTVFDANLIAVRNKFENLKPSSYGGVFHNLEEIYIKKEYR